jgi:hypothetical protein
LLEAAGSFWGLVVLGGMRGWRRIVGVLALMVWWLLWADDLAD